MGKKRIILKSGGEEKAEGADAGKGTSSKSQKRHARRGFAYISATYNNTMITITDEIGEVLGWSSAGALGFKGTKKATPYAAARAAETVAEKAKKYGVQELVIIVKGIGSGRESAIRSLANHGLEILMVRDATPIPHNGPRQKKVRRV